MDNIEAPESYKYYGGYDPAEYYPNYDEEDEEEYDADFDF